MKALSCAIVFLACIFAMYCIGEEEARKGCELVMASRVFGSISLLALYEWWSEVRKS